MTASEDPGCVVLFGGRSEIGIALVERLAPGRRVVLAARRPDELTAEVAAITAAGAGEVHTVAFDADDLPGQAKVLDEVISRFGPIDLAILAFGILGSQQQAEVDPEAAVAVLHTDFVAQAALLTLLTAGALHPQTHPVRARRIVVFTSVAGVRVRRANYVYGSAKAGLDGFAAGLTDALHGTATSLLVVRPGFVIGRMTEGMDPAPMSSTPDQVADGVVAALARGRAEVWIPAQLQVAFAIARWVPRPIWRRMPR